MAITGVQCLIICLQLKGRGTRRNSHRPRAQSQPSSLEPDAWPLLSALVRSKPAGLSHLGGDLLLILWDPTGLGNTRGT